MYVSQNEVTGQECYDTHPSFLDEGLLALGAVPHEGSRCGEVQC